MALDIKFIFNVYRECVNSVSILALQLFNAIFFYSTQPLNEIILARFFARHIHSVPKKNIFIDFVVVVRNENFVL